MKYIIQILLILISASISIAQGISINTTGADANPSAMLDISSNNSGLLIPRIALTGTNDITTITNGNVESLLIYNTATTAIQPYEVTPGFYYWNSIEWVRFQEKANQSNYFISNSQYPTFDAVNTYHIIEGALWVGFDATTNTWKYNKQINGRGTVDPGNPNTWIVNGNTIAYWHGDLNTLPSGTHINNRYCPGTIAFRCNQDDIMINIGGKWMDKYPVTVIDVTSNYSGTTILDDYAGFQGNNQYGNGQEISPFIMAFSQKRQASTGMTWFAAQQIAQNTGKALPSNTEWLAAAGGTEQTQGNAQTNGRDWSSSSPDAECSRYGCFGMAGNIYEWTSTMGQYGNDAGNGNGANWPSSYNNDYTYNIYGNTNGLPSSSGYNLPAAIICGGYWSNGTEAGIFNFNASHAPSSWYNYVGFRCIK